MLTIQRLGQGRWWPRSEGAIRESGLGINPQLNGTIIMLPYPRGLNEERRREPDQGRRASMPSMPRVAIRQRAPATGMDQIKKGQRPRACSKTTVKLWGGRGAGDHRRPYRQGRQALESKQGRDHAGLIRLGTARLLPYRHHSAASRGGRRFRL